MNCMVLGDVDAADVDAAVAADVDVADVAAADADVDVDVANVRVGGVDDVGADAYIDCGCRCDGVMGDGRAAG